MGQITFLSTEHIRYMTPRQLDAAIQSACVILRRSNCAGALQYVPELTWLLFLRILDEREEREEAIAAIVGQAFRPSLCAPYRWRDWAAPDGSQRAKLVGGALGDVRDWVNGSLLPHLRSLGDAPGATDRQKVIAQAMSGVQATRVDTDRNFLDVLDAVNPITAGAVDDTHIFPLSQIYENLLLRMGEKNNDGGQFFTPREVIRAMVRAVDPKVGETVYDPCCGTGGFLAQAYESMLAGLGSDATTTALDTLAGKTFYGREKDNTIYPIALANLVLHGIDLPHIWHGNTLTRQVTDDALFRDAPPTFDVVLTNPPFGGKEGKEAQTRFAYKTGATQVLFLQHVIDSLSPDGRCGIVVDEGLLFKTNERAFVQTKRKLLDECDLWAVVSLPAGVFTSAGAGVKTSLLFFTKGTPTKSVWYYDLSDVKVGKKSPLTRDRFEDFFRMLPDRADSERSWTVSREKLDEKGCDLKAVNPNAGVTEDTRSPEELLDLIEERGREVAAALADLRALLGKDR